MKGYVKGIWVLDSIFGKLWVRMKEEKIIVEEDKFVIFVWFFCDNDIVMLGGFDWVRFYDIKIYSVKFECFEINNFLSWFVCFFICIYFFFYFDY